MTHSFNFVALGDMPYRAGDVGRFRQLVSAINRMKPAFSVHLGDLKKGSHRCATGRYKEVLALFEEFEHPLVYTPGDNDWADCHKKKAGRFDPLERLRTLRQTFYPDDLSLGATPMTVHRQGATEDADSTLENVRWRYNQVLFACIHVTGQDNTRGRDRRTNAADRRRNADNIEWLEEAFELARSDENQALVLATHANLWFPKPKDLRKALRRTLKLLRKRAAELDKPILVIHGDKHRFIFDQPLYELKDGMPVLTNVFRLQVPGDRDIRAVKVTVHKCRQTPFSVSLISP